MKHLDPAWVAGLPDRGTPLVLTRSNSADLTYVGMPVGGIGAGQLYIGGDGKLWWWDIFNTFVPRGKFPVEQGAAYMHPPREDGPVQRRQAQVEQGFGICVSAGGRTWQRTLDRNGFEDIRFSGDYPEATVTYADAQLPVSVSLVAMSPFIPLDTAASSLPATILRYRVRNRTDVPADVMLSGWLENSVMTGDPAAATLRRNRIVARDGMTFLECSCIPEGDAGMAGPVPDSPAFGSMGLALLGAPADVAIAGQPEPPFSKATLAIDPIPPARIGVLGRTVTVAPGTEAEFDFVLTWYFPNVRLPRIAQRRDYGDRFADARSVAEYVRDGFERLTRDTDLWCRTWADSTLPAWFLRRTFANVSTLATSTTYLVDHGRYYAYEGVYSCPGTCAHVYHYAQAAAHLFPDLERGVRERVDLGLAYGTGAKAGEIEFRAEYEGGMAVDAQAGTLLRCYREHRMSPDDGFLRRNWARIRGAYEPLFKLDPDGNGILEGAQMNTLDKPWYGEIAWLSGLYVAALRAGVEMARVCGDADFGERCQRIADRGFASIPARLFEGGYFINRVDPAHPEAINSGTGCEIDQVLGQSWAFQVGLPRVLPVAETRAALRSLWRYNFTTDAGAYRRSHPQGRWFGADGEAGMLLCTFPRSDWDYQRAAGAGPAWATGYFNEFFSGTEHQVAAHLIWEGLVPEGLALERAIDDRYAASKRNPWNEVECGSHYGRAMASYGVFLAACGFEYDGPAAHIGFAPRLSPGDFRAAFTAAEGWGSYAQSIEHGQLRASVTVQWGRLRLRSIALAPVSAVSRASVSVGDHPISARVSHERDRTLLTFDTEVRINAGQALTAILNP